MKNKRFLHFFLIAGLIALALDCTCAWAAQPVPAAMAGCHQHESPQKKEAPADCCGKCQTEKIAAFTASNFNQIAADAKVKSNFYALSAPAPAVTADSSEFPVFETGLPVYVSPGHSPSGARAPPAVNFTGF